MVACTHARAMGCRVVMIAEQRGLSWGDALTWENRPALYEGDMEHCLFELGHFDLTAPLAGKSMR